jgi:hypothetical protein
VDGEIHGPTLMRSTKPPFLSSEHVVVVAASKHPHVAFEPVGLVGKRAAPVQPPRFNLVRDHGVLAAAAGFVRTSSRQDRCPYRKPHPPVIDRAGGARR